MDVKEPITPNQKFVEPKEFKLNSDYKRIFDCVHGYVVISNMAMRFIDSVYFQRLRRLKQLGTCCYVFPAANHSRFEHLIGTYHLSKQLMDCISKRTSPNYIEKYLRSIPELQDYYKRTYNGDFAVLDEYVKELVNLAALCHDLGHGPFSHVFDDRFIPKIRNGAKQKPNDLHEERSGMFVEAIVKSDPILSSVIKEPEITFIKNVINPKSTHTGFLYEIVSNSQNGLDVDKYDYITRDSFMVGIKSGFDFSRLVSDVYIVEDRICYYPDNVLYEVKKLYQCRYDLHKTIYSHKAVVAAQFMIVELFQLLDPILHISESVNDPKKFGKMTDDYIMTATDHLTSPYVVLKQEHKSLIEQAKIIVDRLNNHNLYVFIGEHTDTKKINITIDDFKKLKDFETSYLDNILLFHNKIGFVSGNKKNPFDNLYSFSDDKDTPEAERRLKKLNNKQLSQLLPSRHQEHVIMIFYRIRGDKVGEGKIEKWFNEIIKTKYQD